MKDLLRQLIQADSTPEKGELEAAQVTEAYFKKHGVQCEIDRWDDRRANVLGHVRSGGNRPALLFVCHLDVVSCGREPWNYPPFEAHETRSKVYGRGAVDMKGGIAAAVAAICESVAAGTKLQGDIIFAATAGEETDSTGIRRFMQDTSTLPKLGGIIIPEPTDLAVVTAHRGLLWLEIATTGKATHSSMPQRGVNAIMSMRRVLDALEHYQVAFEPHPLLGPCSVSVNTIQGGEAMNIVPDSCTIGIDIRTLPGQDLDAIRHDLESLLARLRTEVAHFNARITTVRAVGAMETDPECEFVQTFCQAVDVDLTNVVGFTTDAPHLAPLGAPIIIYGPGKPSLCHQVDEHIALADLERAVACFKNAIRHLLA
ncbi:MAG: M20 family metallopeptidase [Sedimentisphaerales bacterium]|nr:M20 family metallopeptidase [Sedimentisphaerales bacterium]